MNAQLILPEAVRAGAIARGLFGPHVAVASLDPRRDHARLEPSEERAIEHAIPHRRREFIAGRCAARRAMADLGLGPMAVDSAPDRAPVWPEGLVGSISHCDAVCVAALARNSDAASLGIDVESQPELAEELLDLVCTGPELAWLATQPKDQRGRLGMLIFSAKESVYKCQYPLTRVVLDFDALCLRFEMNTARFEASFNLGVGAFAPGARIRGRFSMGGGLILTGAQIVPAEYAVLQRGTG